MKLVTFIKKVIYEIIKTITQLNYRQKFKVLENIYFGLLVNALYGILNRFNLIDIFISLVAFYGIIKLYEKGEHR